MTQARKSGQQIAPSTKAPEFDPTVVDVAKSNLVPANFAKAQRSDTVVKTAVPSMGTRGNEGVDVKINPDGTPQYETPPVPQE